MSEDEVRARRLDADQALAVPATPLRVDGLTPPEGDTVSEAIEPLLRFHETGGHEGDGSDERLALIRAALQSRQSPTISDTAGIENALWEYLALLGRRLPDGGIAVHSVVHVPSLARAVIAALQSRVSPQAGMREALEERRKIMATWGDKSAGNGLPEAVGHQLALVNARIATLAALSTAPIPMSEDANDD